MKENDKKKQFVYSAMMKNARKTYRSLGIVLILFLIFFGALRDYVFVPVLGKLWSLSLMTTPDGYINNTNMFSTLLKSPWIILFGFMIIILYVAIALWQVNAVVIGIGYSGRGKRIRLRDLFRVSFRQLGGRWKTENLMILVYVLIITPLVNFYHASDMISSFIIPEYIQDFINSRPLLLIPFIIAALLLIYVALRWLFVVQAFVLKKADFTAARKESEKLTGKEWFRDGINLALYSVIELVRLSILPMALLLIPVFVCYCLTKNLQFSHSLFTGLGVSIGLDVIRSITGTLVSVSIMCFSMEMYSQKQEECGVSETYDLPEIVKEARPGMSLNRLEIIICSAVSVIVAAAYLVTVNAAQKDSSVILELFGKREIVAHKGYSSKAPENTMPAFKLADEYAPVSYIELDVWSTKDGVPVVIHNRSIKEATGIDKNIDECTYEELQSIPAVYSWEGREFDHARIPSLEEVIAAYGQSTPLLIEIKGYNQDPELPSKIVKLMKEYGCEDTSLIHSGDYGALQAVKEIAPEIQCGLIMFIVTGDCYDMPYADFFSIEHTFVNQNTVAAIHRHGKKVYAWTVNYDESVDDLIFTDVDGLITDYPEIIQSSVSDTNGLVDDAIKSIPWKLRDSEKSDAAIQKFRDGQY